jgi:hypothetical protein
MYDDNNNGGLALDAAEEDGSFGGRGDGLAVTNYTHL